MIRLAQVQVTLTGRPILHDLTLTLNEPRIGLIGPNGGGKSTFARLLNGLVLPSSGTVTLITGGGRELDTRRDGREVRRRVGFVFTDPDSQIVMPTVAEDVAFSLKRFKLSRDDVAARVAAQLTAIGLADHADHPAHLLSGGQKQLLALSSVLVTEPAILVCDEPTTLLDLRNGRLVSDVLMRLEQQLIVATHDLDLVSRCDRVLVIVDGAVAFDGSAAAAVAWYRDWSGH